LLRQTLVFFHQILLIADSVYQQEKKRRFC